MGLLADAGRSGPFLDLDEILISTLTRFFNAADDPAFGFDLDLELDPLDRSLGLLLPDLDLDPEATFFLDFFGYSSVSIRIRRRRLT
jgi:hypothetical protein